MISNPDADPWAFHTEAIGGDVGQNISAVDTVTLDDLLTDDTPYSTIIVKIDIEGAEREVFSKNTSWLEAVDLLMIEIHDWLYPGEGNGRKFFSALVSKPLDYILHGENLFCFRIKEAKMNEGEKIPALLTTGP